MRSVFVVEHEGEREPGVDEVKLIGVYATKVDAEEAVKRLAIQPGFRDYLDRFSIDEYEIGRDHWSEGFGPGEDEVLNDVN